MSFEHVVYFNNFEGDLNEFYEWLSSNINYSDRKVHFGPAHSGRDDIIRFKHKEDAIMTKLKFGL